VVSRVDAIGMGSIENCRLGRGGLRFSDGGEEFRICLWPELRAERRDFDPHYDCWEECEPEQRLVVPAKRIRVIKRDHEQLEFDFRDERRPAQATIQAEALAAFRAAIPPRVARAVEPLHWRQWSLLAACQKAPQMVDLIRSNPVLASLWLLLEPHEFQTAEELASVAQTSQRALLEEMGIEGRASTVRMLRKVPPATFDQSTAEVLMRLMRSDQRMARLQQVPRLGRGLLAMVDRPVLLQLCAPSLLLEMASSEDELSNIQTVQALGSYANFCWQLRKSPRQGLASVQEVHARRKRELFAVADQISMFGRESLAQLADRPRPPWKSEEPYSEPPLELGKEIEPIRTAAELEREGHELENCLARERTRAQYDASVRTGRFYFYRVLVPERCTLMLVRHRAGWWKRDTLLGHQNRNPHRRTRRMVSARIAASHGG